MKTGKRILSILLSLMLVLGAVSVGGVSVSAASNVVLTLDPSEVVTDAGDTAELTLVVEGLGTDPNNNQISSVVFTSSDTSVADNFTVNAANSYVPTGGSDPTGLQYTVLASTFSTGSATVTVKVTDTDNNVYSRTASLIVRGIVANPKNITLEVGEACVVFAERYGFTESQSSMNLTWRNTPNSNWITLGVHGNNRQNEAYYVKGNSVGTGTVTVALGSSYSDTINVTVVPKKSLTVMQDGEEVTSPINLSDSTAVLEAVPEGFDSSVITWESSHPNLVSVSQDPEDSKIATITRIENSDTVVAVKATATDGSVTRTKTVYVINDQVPSLKIIGSGIITESNIKHLTITEGETAALSAMVSGTDATATIWSATTDDGRVPVKLNSTVGKNITITGRLNTDTPVAVTAANEGYSDTVYVTVTPSDEKFIRITGDGLGADGVLELAPDGSAQLNAQLSGISELSVINWDVSIAPNNENVSEGGICPINLEDSIGSSAVVTAIGTSTDFAKVKVSVLEDGKIYSDEIYVKVTGCDIISAARYITVFQNDVVTLQTADGSEADWKSTTQKTYLGDLPPTASAPVTTVFSSAKATVTSNGNVTMNPSKITAVADGNTDSVYVYVHRGSSNTGWSTVTFDLNGGYGTAPDTVVFSSDDDSRSILLTKPDAAYPDDGGEYEFYGWSEYPNAGEPDANRPVYFPGQTYTVNKAAVTLYAIWTEKTENAMFFIRINGDIGAEPGAQSTALYAKSGIYIEDALDPAGFYYNANGVESHLAKLPSDADIARVLSLESTQYDPDSDRVIWYVVKRTANDAAGLPNWRVDGVLVKGGKVSLTYEKNISEVTVNYFPNPPRVFYDADSVAGIVDLVPTCGADSFVGWNTKPNGSGQWYSSTGTLYQEYMPPEGETVLTSIVISEDTTLYAVWTGSFNQPVPDEETECETIEYGTYPQSKVTDEDLLATLNALAPENFDDWTSYGYYYNDSGETYSGKMQPGDYMRYYDAVLDGVKYRAVLFTSYRPYYTDYAGSTDNSYQDENGYNTDTVYWFRFEPIEWRVLDPDEGLVLCASAIDSQAYNNYIFYADSEYWGDADKTYYANNYAESSIRKWLNDDFINTAFSASQQENIKKTALNNDAYSTEYSQYNSAQTNDKVFLLSYADATNSAYGFNADASNYDTARRLQGSDYAKCQGLYVYNSSGSEYDGNSWWWLRSPYIIPYFACTVGSNGRADGNNGVYNTDNGVVPALKLLNLKSDPTGAPVTIDPGMELTISPEEPVWGDDITITATLPESATGTVTFRLDEADTGETVTVENGRAVYAIEGKSIEVGDYTVLASYSGDERYNSVSEELPFAVDKAETEVHITVEPENPLCGQEISITATVDGDAKIINFSEHGFTSLGGATLRIDESPIETLASETNTVTFNIPGLDAGEHNIEVVYNGDEHYNSAYAVTTIFVGRSEPEITVTAEDITYGEAVQATVTVPDNATGNITAGLLKYGGIDPDTNEEIWNTVNGAPASITSGEQFEISGLAAGDYKLTVSLGEDSNYFSGSAEKAFKVNKAEPDMSVTVDPQTPVADGDFTVTTHLPSDAQGNVIYRFSDVDLLGYTTVTNGEAPFGFECLRSGTYHGTAKYLPADGSNYAEKEITFEFNVSAADPNMTLTAPDVDYGKTATVTANLPLNAMWCDVTFYLDGEETGKSVYVSQGKAVCEYTGLSIGEHTVKAEFSGDDRYFSVTKEISFTVNSVDCALTINYVYADGTEAAETYTDSVEIFKDYSVTSPEIEGCTPDIATVEGTMGDEDMDGKTVTVTYTANTYKVTYVVDGEKLTEMDATFGQSVPRPRTPQREGYTFKWVDEIPATMPAQDVTINGKFTPIEYTATFVDENGETVETVTFTVETESITEPAVPEKSGYTGEWEEYTLGTSDITIKPVYANITSIQIENYEENSETGYKEDKTFTVKADDLPDGAEIHWFVNGKDAGTGESYTVEDPTDDYNIYAEVIDKDGNTLDTTKVQSVKVKNGFFDRLKAFFAELIEKILGKAIIDFLSSVC